MQQRQPKGLSCVNGYGIVAFMPRGREKPRDYSSNDMHKMSRSFVSPTPSLKIVVVVSAMAMTLDRSQIPLCRGWSTNKIDTDVIFVTQRSLTDDGG